MKALVVLENHFFLDSNCNVWCDRVVDYNYLKRYLNVFDSIVLIGRAQIVDSINDKKLQVSGENVEFVPLPDFKGAKGVVLNLFKIKRIVRKQLKSCDCAIYRAPTHLSLVTYKEVLKQKKPLLLEFMMAANKMFDGDGSIKKVLNKIVNRKTKRMCMRANGVSYVTEYILQKEYPCMAIKYPNNKNYFTGSYSSIDLSDEMFYRQKWNKNNKPKFFNIIHTGYMDSYRKGQDVVINVLKILSDKGYDVRLTFVGDGEKRKEFEKLVCQYKLNDKVEFTGLVSDKSTVIKYLRRSHFMVFPTQSEGLPRTLIEAMAQGLVCLSSPVDGIPELLDDEFLIDYNDINGYANKLVELIENWDKCCIESEKNYTKSLKYSYKNLCVKRKNFYSKIVK